MENKSTLLETAKKKLPIKRNKFHWFLWLAISIIFTALLVLLIIYFAPKSPIVLINFKFTPFLPFFFLLFFTLFSWVVFITKSKAHGILIACFFVIYLLFRLNHLTDPFFLILLLAIVVTLELFISNKR